MVQLSPVSPTPADAATTRNHAQQPCSTLRPHSAARHPPPALPSRSAAASTIQSPPPKPKPPQPKAPSAPFSKDLGRVCESETAAKLQSIRPAESGHTQPATR